MLIRLGAPRRLFTSHQGRTGADAGPPPNERVEARRQAGQSSGLRGLPRRWSLLRLAAHFEEEGRRENLSKRPSLERREQEADQEQEHEQMKGHRNPRGLIDVEWIMIKEE